MKRFLLIFISLLFLNIHSYSQIPAGYYDDASGLSGDALKSALHNIIDNHTELSYDDLWTVLKETDEDPNNKNNFILIYTGRSIPKTDAYPEWNREHVWAKSHGDFGTTPPAGTDAHHLRPSDCSVNSDRGNKDFDNGGEQHTEATECYWDSDSWEPRDAVKGDVARMMFYMTVRYEGDASGEPDLELVDYITGSTSSPIFGVLSTLLEWNNQDPVDDFERNKNNVVYSYQNNRNPFIDHPEYVAQIWGGVSMNSVPTISDVTITPSIPTATNTVSVSATITDSDGTITNAKINWGTTSGSLTNEISMSVSSGSTYITNSEIPAQTDGTFVYYTVSATDDSSATTTTDEYNYEVGNTTVTVLSEDFSSCPPSGWNTEDVAGTENWNCSTGYMSINAYDGTGACDDWLITPSFDLDSYTEEILSFTSWTKYTDTYYPPVELKYSDNYSGTGDPTAATWNTLTCTWSAEDSQTWTYSGDVDISGISGSSVYFAIQYTSSGNGGGSSSQWEIDDFQVTGKPVEGNNNPTISSVSHTPTSPIETEDVSISANITDNDGTISLSKVKWGTVSGNYTNNISMTADGDNYSGTLSAQAAGTTVYYVIYAEDNDAGSTQSTEYYVSFSAAGNNFPTINSVSHTPTSPLETEDVSISANITDTDGTISLSEIKWGTTSGNYTNNISMTADGDNYSGTLSAQATGTTVYYVIYAEDNDAGSTQSTEYSVSFSAAGNDFPTISSVSHTPTSPLETEDVSISANITDNDGTISLSEIKWGTTSGNYTNNISMTADGDNYSGTLSAQAAGTNVYYVIYAEDNEAGSTQSTEHSVSFSSSTNNLPVISDVTILPGEPNELDTVTISANIIDTDGTISSAVLKWKLASSETTHEIDMTFSDNKYSCKILPQHKFESVYFMITATDNKGGETLYTDGRYYINESTGIEKLNTEKISIFPNPADNYLYIKSNTENALFDIAIYNALGNNVILLKNINISSKYKIELNNIQSGLYFVNIKNEKQDLTYKLIIK